MATRNRQLLLIRPPRTSSPLKRIVMDRVTMGSFISRWRPEVYHSVIGSTFGLSWKTIDYLTKNQP